MTENEKLPTLTLESLEEDVIFACDVATLARDGLSANTLILFNLIIELSKAGLIDGNKFAKRLRSQCHLIKETNEKIAAQCYLDELITILNSDEQESYPSKAH